MLTAFLVRHKTLNTLGWGSVPRIYFPVEWLRAVKTALNQGSRLERLFLGTRFFHYHQLISCLSEGGVNNIYWGYQFQLSAMITTSFLRTVVKAELEVLGGLVKIHALDKDDPFFPEAGRDFKARGDVDSDDWVW
jgi:hypothetical protein